MGLDYELIHGQTPLEPEESEGLRITTITQRKQLDEFEQQNILQAIRWTMSTKFEKDEILSEAFIKALHKKMYGEVWTWAGKFRQTNKSIGVDYFDIPVRLKTLLDDCTYWIKHNVYKDPDEIAVRFKHGIVAIHCFSNGNGRHSRLIGDLISQKIFGRPVFTWGSASLVQTGTQRKEYIQCLRAADANDFLPLIAFARK